MLSNWGMRPTSADGGEDALADLQRAPNSRQLIRLHLIDPQMPEMDGFALAEQITKDPALAPTPRS